MSKPELKSAFDDVGFMDTGFISLTSGTAAIHYGIKRLKIKYIPGNQLKQS